MFQPNSTMTMEEDINVDETTLNPVKEFTYLGSIIANDGHIEAELEKRMSKASMSFGRLRERLWNNHNVSIRVKGNIYRAIIMSNLLYGVETWTVYRRHLKKLHAFMMGHLRSIMEIRWQDKVTNIKVLKRAGLPSMEDLLIRKNLCWTGHILRMLTDRLPRQVLYSQLPYGQRPRVRPRLRYKDTVKRNLKKGILIPTRGNLWHYSEMYGETPQSSTGNEGSLCRMRPTAMMMMFVCEDLTHTGSTCSAIE